MNSDETYKIVNLWLSVKSSITGLWGIYIGATFTGAAFSIAAPQINFIQMIIVVLGFSAFAIGHFFLLKHQLEKLVILSDAVQSIHDNDAQQEFLSVLEKVSRKTYPPINSLIAHLVIDLCVIALIISPLIFGMSNLTH